jgi:hypothetical protein
LPSVSLRNIAFYLVILLPKTHKSTTYTTRPKVCEHLLNKHLIPKSWALIRSWSPLCCYNSLHSSGRSSTRCWNIASGTCFSTATRALVSWGTDVGRLGLARSRLSNSPQWCLMGLRSGLSACQSSSSTPISTNNFCMDLALCTGALSC